MKQYYGNCDLGVSYDIYVNAKNMREATKKIKAKLKKKAIILSDWRIDVDEMLTR